MKNPCENCGYHWQYEWEDFPVCHYEGPHQWAPCEAEEEADRIAREQKEYEDEIRSLIEEFEDE